MTVMKKACIDQNLVHERLETQTFAPRSENNMETAITDRLLVPPLTLHQIFIFRFLLACSYLHYHISQDSRQLPLPLASGSSLMPASDCSKGAPSRFLAKCVSSTEGIHCKPDKSISLSASKSLPSSSLLHQ